MSDNEVRVGVTHLLTTYQYLADTGRVQRLAQLFAPDGVLEIGVETFTGPTEVLGLFTRTSGQFVDADFQFIGTRGLDHWGTYRDVAVPIEDEAGWRFKRRRVITEGFAPGSHLAPGVSPTT